MEALNFYALLEKLFIELNQLIPLPNWSNFVVSTACFLVLITILHHVLLWKSILVYMTLLPGHYFRNFDCLVLWVKPWAWTKTSSQKPWNNRVHPSFRQYLDSTCLNIIFLWQLFVWQYYWIWIFQNFLHFELPVPFLRVNNSHCWVPSNTGGCPVL